MMDAVETPPALWGSSSHMELWSRSDVDSERRGLERCDTPPAVPKWIGRLRGELTEVSDPWAREAESFLDQLAELSQRRDVPQFALFIDDGRLYLERRTSRYYAYVVFAEGEPTTWHFACISPADGSSAYGVWSRQSTKGLLSLMK